MNMMVTVSGERSCKSAELGLQQKTNSGFNKVKTLQRHKNDLVSQNGPCLVFGLGLLRSLSNNVLWIFSAQKFRQTNFRKGGGTPQSRKNKSTKAGILCPKTLFLALFNLFIALFGPS